MDTILIFFLVFDLLVILIRPFKFRVSWTFGSGEEEQNGFSRWPSSWISDPNNLSFLSDVQVAQIRSTNFRVSWPFCTGENRKIDFEDSPHSDHLGYQIGMILASFDLHVALVLSIKFRFKWPFGSGKVAQSRFSRWPPSWISNWNDVSYFYLKVAQIFLSSFESIGLLVREKKRKIDFHDGCHDSHLGCPIATILAILDLHVIQILPINFRVYWPFGVKVEKRKIDFQDGRHLRCPIGILATFDLQVAQILSVKFRVN